ncbi:MAG: phytanoyl-CoA dioxygenase family protein [Fimbriimonadaceae bacterium]|nr:phytanoyl-CoA dioxygenase family protein [Fimbriimonadaceae bacterium]
MLRGLAEAYARDGYAIARGVIDADLAGEAVEHCRWLMAKHPELRPEDLGHTLVPNDPFWVRLVSDDRLLDVAQEFIGPNIALFASHYIVKAPRTGRPVLWHQDGSYWPLDPMEVVTLWLACGPATRANGCMKVIPGTQHLSLQEMRENSEVDSVLHSEIDPTLVDASKEVYLELEPGDVSIHHPNVIHGSGPNHSDQWRFGLTIRYIPTSTRITVPEAGCPFLLRGEAVPGVNTYLPRPG